MSNNNGKSNKFPAETDKILVDHKMSILTSSYYTSSSEEVSVDDELCRKPLKEDRLRINTSDEPSVRLFIY